MPQGDEGTVSAMYRHTVNVYNAMKSEAKPQTFNGDIKSDESVTQLVYTGFPTTLISQRLNLPVPYYSTIRRALLDMGCVEILQRGGGGTPSQWILYKDPSEEDWARVSDDDGKVATRGSRRLDAVEELMEGMVARLQDLEGRLRKVEEL